MGFTGTCTLQWMAEEKSANHYNLNFAIPCICKVHAFHRLSKGCHTPAPPKCKDKYPLHVPLRLHHKKTLAHPDPPWQSQLMMQHLVLSPTGQTLLTCHTDRGMGQHSTLRERHILPASLTKSRDWEQSTHLLNFRLDVQKTRQFSDLFSTLCQ